MHLNELRTIPYPSFQPTETERRVMNDWPSPPLRSDVPQSQFQTQSGGLPVTGHPRPSQSALPPRGKDSKDWLYSSGIWNLNATKIASILLLGCIYYFGVDYLPKNVVSGGYKKVYIKTLILFAAYGVYSW